MAKVLVAYFSASGVTARVAHALAQAVGADVCEIEPAQPYTAKDLNWMDKTSRSSREMDDEDCRPDLAETIDVAKYDVVGERRVRRQDGRALLHFRRQRRRQDGRGLAQVLLG